MLPSRTFLPYLTTGELGSVPHRGPVQSQSTLKESELSSCVIRNKELFETGRRPCNRV